VFSSTITKTCFADGVGVGDGVDDAADAAGLWPAGAFAWAAGWQALLKSTIATPIGIKRRIDPISQMMASQPERRLKAG
jgi:hypothetical protein